jgi:hypothetical protein
MKAGMVFRKSGPPQAGPRIMQVGNLSSPDAFTKAVTGENSPCSRYLRPRGLLHRPLTAAFERYGIQHIYADPTSQAMLDDRKVRAGFVARARKGMELEENLERTEGLTALAFLHEEGRSICFVADEQVLRTLIKLDLPESILKRELERKLKEKPKQPQGSTSDEVTEVMADEISRSSPPPVSERPEVDSSGNLYQEYQAQLGMAIRGDKP